MEAARQDLNHQRREFEDRLTRVQEEEDPLSVYVQFVQWIVNNFGEKNPKSGLRQLLKEATEAFQDDSLYKTDLRYLKLWTLYAKQLDAPSAISIYVSLLKLGIGSSYSLLYEEYSAILEEVSNISEAHTIYQTGIKRQARPLERLKNRYSEFQKRHGSSAAEPSSKRRHSGGKSSVFVSTAASRYALMLAPQPPGKRPEQLKFDLSLLYTEEHGEFCIQEARARTMGLLGKKWPPVPSEPVSMSASQSSTSTSTSSVSFKDQKTVRPHRKKSMLHREPTVTINTKEALADVFGMYNSPDKTLKMSGLGTKHAPVKKVESITPLAPPRVTLISQNENALKTPTPTFRPFVDETPSAPKSSGVKFMPFVDSDTKTPRTVLSDKNPASVTRGKEALKPKAFSEDPNVVSKVFTPAKSMVPPLPPLRDVFTDDHGKPQLKQRPAVHERARSHHDVPSVVVEQDPNVKTPFKVFSRPENVFTPQTPTLPPVTPRIEGKPTFHPYRDEPAQPAPIPASENSTSTWSNTVVDIEDEEEDENERYEQELDADDHYDDDYDDAPEDYEVLIAPEDGEAQYASEGVESFRDPPLGGRFGQFNVMTPITERTFEFTSSTRCFDTPSERLHRVSETDEEVGPDDAQMLGDGEEEVEEQQGAPIKPLVLPGADSLQVLEEQTGKLSLSDALTLSSNFKPPNPCNAFDSPILAAVLSRIPSDPGYHDLRSEEAKKLENLEKFSKKARKTSGNSSTAGALDLSSAFPLCLAGHKYQVSNKLGEGGFGSVFQAQDLGMKQDEDDESDEDLDEEETPLVAIKVVKPRNLWEYHVLRRLHLALAPSLRRSIVFPHALYAFRDESFLVLDLCSQGPLLDIVNRAGAAGISQQGGCLDELLVVFFTVELLRLLEGMHNIGFIHGDLKIDNCLLRLEDVPGASSNWSSVYDPSGEGGWAHKGLKVIDFGRTIDTRLFPSGQQFIAEWATDERDCFEIQQGKPWTFQTDYFGLAGIVYCMLFGKYIHSNAITTVSGEEQRYRIATPFKRYWQTDLWNDLFDVLLNPRQVNGELPVSDELARIRKEMETWLQANCNRTSNTLKGLLKKVEMSCLRG
ncbi:hypothetical protein C8J56DRAFT_856676 [Mycena floridula]|nr:hypothetical protein C8J56DRAFT_856676 [Mycena floridula]